MIVTLTANPSLDRAITLGDVLRPGEVQSAISSREDAGGKGINVSRVVAAAGVVTAAVLPLSDDDPYAAALRAAGVPARSVPIIGHARSNLTIVDPAGETTKLNLPGATLTSADVAALIEAVVAECEGARWLVLAGSVPPGAGDDFYVRVIEAVRGHWGAAAPRIAVDTSGPSLTSAVQHGRPDLIKPNELELAELAGVDLPSEALEDTTALVAAVRSLAAALVPSKVGAALVTLGAHGAVLVHTDDGALSTVVGTPPRIEVVSTVGAGDSSLAGFLLADVSGEDPAGCVERSIRYGAAAASLPGTQAPTPADLPSGEVRVTVL